MRQALRLDDSVGRGRTESETAKLMNVKMPTAVLDRITEVARRLRVKKTEVIVATLNEGLDGAIEEFKGWIPPPKVVIPGNRRCAVSETGREKVAKGMRATHYQAARWQARA